MKKRIVVVHDKIRWGYCYPLGAPTETGRRVPEEGRWQIGRWKKMRRHVRQIEKNCERGDLACRPRQRQALLHWAYNRRNI